MLIFLGHLFISTYFTFLPDLSLFSKNPVEDGARSEESMFKGVIAQ